jgi:hypothetical protein
MAWASHRVQKMRTGPSTEDRLSGTDVCIVEENKMDRLVKTAWRAFWVGLGASAVLITQSLRTGTPPASGHAMPSVTQAPSYELPWATPAPASPGTVDPRVPRDPFDAMSGRVVARVRDES